MKYNGSLAVNLSRLGFSKKIRCYPRDRNHLDGSSVCLRRLQLPNNRISAAFFTLADKLVGDNLSHDWAYHLVKEDPYDTYCLTIAAENTKDLNTVVETITTLLDAEWFVKTAFSPEEINNDAV